MTYLKRIESGDDPVAESEQLTAADYARELVGFGVRMLDGVDLAAVGSRTGVDTVELFFDAIDVCQQRGWIVQGGTRIRLTREGILFGDSVAREFLF